jgi:hypothetical protein
MDTVCITLKSFRENAERIAGEGATVTTGAPYFTGTPDLLLVFAHPNAAGNGWMNDAHRLIATADDVRRWPLRGTVVFLGVCYGLENQAMLDALFEAGAAAVLAGPGDNYGGSAGVLAGADVLAMAFRGALEAGVPVRVAWHIARLYARLAVHQGIPGAEDAQAFELLEAPDRQPGRTWLGWLGGLVTLATLLIALLLGDGGGRDPRLLTLFSSIIGPPAGVTEWYKEATVNGVGQDIYSTISLVDGDTISVTDWITATAAFTLTEAWSTTAISLTDWITASGGTVTTGSGMLTWTVSSPISTTAYGLTKTWSTVAGTWTASTLVETLQTASENKVVTLTLGHTASTATPTPYPTYSTAMPTIEPTVTASPTPVPTFTPYYTPEGWAQQRAAMTPTATPTPCIFGCEPVSGTTGITYTIPIYLRYLPLVTRAYRGIEWSTSLYINNVLTDTGYTITTGDTVIVLDTLLTGRGYTFTLVSNASAGLSLTDTLTNTTGATLTTGARSYTWTVIDYGGGSIAGTYSVGAGAATETITRVLSLYGDSEQLITRTIELDR